MGLQQAQAVVLLHTHTHTHTHNKHTHDHPQPAQALVLRILRRWNAHTHTTLQELLGMVPQPAQAFVLLYPDAEHPGTLLEWLIHLTWLIHVTWLICMCVTTHLYVRHDSFTQTLNTLVQFLSDSFIWHHSFMLHDSFACVPWLICMCDMTHSRGPSLKQCTRVISNDSSMKRER